MRPGIRKALRVTAYVYLTLAGALILVGYGSIWYFQGFGKLMDIMSPFNVINYISVVVTLAPGLLLLAWAEKAPKSN